MRHVFCYIFLCFILLFIAANALAQRHNGLTIEGLVSVEDGSSGNAIIEMYRDGQRLDDYGIGRDGHYKLELPYNCKYELIFRREDNFKQKIVVETAVPKAVLEKNPKFPQFPVNINLFKEIQGIDDSFSENTVLKIYYSRKVDNFISELYYNDAQIRKLINQAVLQAGIVDRRASYMSKLTRAELAKLRKEYNKLLTQAAKEYASEEFLAALDGYKAASRIFPEEQFPKDRINEINDLLGLVMAAEELEKAKIERFNKLVQEGDLHFSQKYYDASKTSYERALSIKPADKYVTGQLTKIAEMQQLQIKNKEYRNLIADADMAFQGKLYDDALELYRKALVVNPNATYPKDKVAEINAELLKQHEEQEKQRNYEAAMQEGKQLFGRQAYNRALTVFNSALTIRPGDEMTRMWVNKTTNAIQKIKDKDAFDKFIELADKDYEKQKYPEALINYEEALEIVTTDAHAGKRVVQIKGILQQQKELQLLIANADKQFDLKKYTDAQALYEKVLTQKPGNTHAQERITAIKRIMSGIALDKQYAAVINTADRLLAELQYEEARNKYQDALGIKPREAYPQDKIIEIDRKMAAIAQQDADYQSAIARADKFFKAANYSEAKSDYSNAGKLKPKAAYPPEMIAKIDSILSAQDRLAREAAAAEAARLATVRAEKNKKYAALIVRADALFSQKDYQNSRAAYQEALEIKADESYPQERSIEIDRILKDIADKQAVQEELDRKYATLIMQADRYFSTKDYSRAKESYQQADMLKPAKAYPKEKVAEIDEIFKQKALHEEYREIILIADGQFKTGKYTDAITQYQKALEVSPDEEYPKTQVQTIRELMDKEELRKQQEAEAAADLARRQENINDMEKELDEQKILKEQGINALYDEFIKKADAYFNDKQYMVSRAWYYKALDLKPDEKYPKKRIAEINRILNEMMLSRSDREYRRFVDLADENFRKNELGVARGWYNRALGLKPEGKYPKGRLVEIERLVKERLQLKSADKIMRYKTEAQKAMEAGETNLARFWYRKALVLNPADDEAKAALSVE